MTVHSCWRIRLRFIHALKVTLVLERSLDVAKADSRRIRRSPFLTYSYRINFTHDLIAGLKPNYRS
jgi:hypothetical protein